MVYNVNEIMDLVSELGLYDGINFSEDECDEFVGQIERYDFSYNTGISKLVLKPKNKDYVIKIPFSTFYEEEDGEYYSFSCYGDRKWNACEYEEELYNLAKRYDFEKFFLPIKFVGVTNNYPIYIQAKAEIIYDNIEKYRTYNSSIDTRKILKEKHIGLMSKLVENWFDAVHMLCREDEFVEFLNFLQIHNIIDDLHEANVGFYEGMPVIIDYAGFNREEEQW